MQLCSGLNKVYKYPFSSEAKLRLMNLQLKQLGTLPHLAIPRRNAQFPEYFEYEAYAFPLEPRAARSHLSAVVHKIVQSITELHRAKIAHLDIQLENICWKDEIAVLIDLDRSVDTDQDDMNVQRRMAKELYVRYCRAEMYRTETNFWTCENLDWKQLGLLIVCIDDSTQEDAFVQKLIKEGQYDAAYHNSWRQ